MKYHYTSGVTGNKKKLNYKKVLPMFVMVGGLYIIANFLSPAVQLFDLQPPQAIAKKLITEKPGSQGNRLYIPQLNIDIPVVESAVADLVSKGAWHRETENGNPLKGGNFILSAQRFALGFTPQQTRFQSPFFSLDKLQTGDELFVDWEGQRYVYEIQKKLTSVSETENLAEVNKLTLYSSDSKGNKSGGEVIEAKPAGIVAWGNGKPHIEKTTN